MENKKPNRCIACTVQQCANHVQTENYCSLDKITVGTHEMNPTVVQCTDCESFILKSGDCGCHSSGTSGSFGSHSGTGSHSTSSPRSGLGTNPSSEPSSH